MLNVPTLADIESMFEAPLLDLIYEAAGVHRAHHDARDMQRCTLLSIKTGGCPEDCSYCPQSARYESSVDAQALLSRDEVKAAAQRAADAGASRFCMGAAWRSAREGAEFEEVLGMIHDVRSLGMEACVTLGMLTDDQALRLKQAGLTSYNHNLDTSEDFYKEIITTRTYQDRLDTLARVQQAGIGVCCGGILGMGETTRDRASMLHTLASLEPQPESVPINALVRMEGTPLAKGDDLDPLDIARMVAIARILMPRARVRLAAGRLQLDPATQALCFLAGANSIFFGEELLTTPNPSVDEDTRMLERLGLRVTESGARTSEPAAG